MTSKDYTRDAAPTGRDRVTAAEAQAAVERIAERRRELMAREQELQREIAALNGAPDAADLERRIRDVMNGQFGQAQRRQLGHLLDDLEQTRDDLIVANKARERAREEVAVARRQAAREIAAQHRAEHRTAAKNVLDALVRLDQAQQAERAIRATVAKQCGGTCPDLLVDCSTVYPREIGVQGLLQRVRAYLAAGANGAGK